jgi:putative nucleotidyltransferase with HDIG domain
MKKPGAQLAGNREKVEGKFSLILEDSRGERSFFTGGFPLRAGQESDFFRQVDGGSRLVSGPFELDRRPAETFLGGDREWDGFHLCLARLRKARKALQSLQEWYESVVHDDSRNLPQAINSHLIFFNSQLIYLIASTDDKEDNLGHSQFVAAYALLLARAMGIEDDNFLTDLQRGALLHDIGKIGLPSSILCKPGPLEPLEREIIKEHPLLGYLMLQDYPFLEGATQVVLYHHEWYNGEGYPFGLKGEEIPLAARIFSLADTLDAILSDRPYRPGRSFELASLEIEKGSGSQFDPAIVDVFLSIPEEQWRQARLRALRLFRLPLVH